MDERERFKFGNPDQKGLMIRRSERPIEKAEINSDIRNFIYESNCWSWQSRGKICAYQA